jgi:hypothetical protein
MQICPLANVHRSCQHAQHLDACNVPPDTSTVRARADTEDDFAAGLRTSTCMHAVGKLAARGDIYMARRVQGILCPESARFRRP